VHSRNIPLIAWGNNKDKGATRESFYFYAPDEYSQEVGGCIQRCMGIDALKGISIVSFEADQKYGTRYYENFVQFIKRVQEELGY
jgi:hypothetical protein